MSAVDAIPLLAAAGGDYQISRSVRLRSSASAYFNRTPASASNFQINTLSFWAKRGSMGSRQALFSWSGVSTGNNHTIEFTAADAIEFYAVGTAAAMDVQSSQVFRDPSACYHIVYAIDTTQATAANRIKLYVNGAQVTAFGVATYPAQNANLQINANQPVNIGRRVDNTGAGYFDGYLTEVNFIDGQALTPSSFGETDAVTGVWKPKKYLGTYGTNGFYLNFSDNSSRLALGHSDTGTHVDIVEADGSNQSIQAGVGACRVSTISTANASYTSAVNEYLVVTPGAALPIASSLKIYFDVNYAWANGRNLYINGTQVSSGNVTVATVSGMQEWTINFAGHGITSLSSITTPVNTGGRAVFYGISIDGNAVVATANDWTPNNISVTAGVTYDSMVDVPTMWADGGNGRGNYATWNATSKSPNLSLTAGNLNTTYASAGNESAGATIGVTSGKWYWESTATNVVGSFPMLGIAKANEAGLRSISGYYPGYTANSWGLYCNTGGFVNNASVLATYSTVATNDVLMFALDMDSGKYWMGKNGTWFNSGVPASGTGSILSSGLTGETIFPMVAEYSASSSVVNFGQRPFAYTPPTGFKALNTQNLPEPTIKKGNAYFDATTYTGNGSSQNITNGGGFQPDLFWAKKRSAVASHALFDSVRGANQGINSDLTNAEITWSGQSFSSNGFTVSAAFSGETNQNGHTFIGWQWKESASAGFDIVTYTGNGTNQTINHSLGVAPKMIIVKSRSAAVSWSVYHASIGAANGLFLNLTNAAAATSSWNGSAPSSSSFTVGATAEANANTATYVAYLFAEVAGFSAFGKYTGNGSADGPFVYCGFRPRFVLLKRSDAVGNWHIWDSARNTFNVAGEELYPNLSNAGYTDVYLDFTSNGFKIRNGTTGEVNANGNTYVYACFAENPFKNSLAR